MTKLHNQDLCKVESVFGCLLRQELLIGQKFWCCATTLKTHADTKYGTRAVGFFSFYFPDVSESVHQWILVDIFFDQLEDSFVRRPKSTSLGQLKEWEQRLSFSTRKKNIYKYYNSNCLLHHSYKTVKTQVEELRITCLLVAATLKSLKHLYQNKIEHLPPFDWDHVQKPLHYDNNSSPTSSWWCRVTVEEDSCHVNSILVYF